MTAPILRRTDQAAVAVLLLLAAVAISGTFALQYARQGGLIEIDHARDRTVDFCVDVNRADWVELTLLPGIGETLARRIVESREREGLFRSVEDLARVHGIGPVTLERIEPFAAFDSGGEAGGTLPAEP